MRFSFSEEQRLLQSTVRDFLQGECGAERIRAFWETPTGRSAELWKQLADLGVLGVSVPEEYGGMGLDEIDSVLLLEETGRVALAEPLISSAVIAAPLLCELHAPDLAKRWLPALAGGEAIVAVGHPVNAFVSDAHVADLLLLSAGDEIHAVSSDCVKALRQVSNDPARRIYSVEWTPSEATRVASGTEGRALLESALDRGALACAAQLLGVTQQLVDLSVRYACERQQFGVAIGTFQAIKHMLADLEVKLEYARPLVYRAAWSVARKDPCRAVDVSMAKHAASEAASAAARTALQVHGAIGYTWEQDVHVWMRRAWSLELAWGSAFWHRKRVEAAVLDEVAPSSTFGYSAPSTGAGATH